MDENGYYRPSKKGLENQRNSFKVSEKSGNFVGYMRGSRKIRQGGCVILLKPLSYFIEGRMHPLGPIVSRGQLGPRGDPIASLKRSVPEFLKKPIATCDFQVGGGGSGPGPLFLNFGSAHGLHKPLYRSAVAQW